MNKRLVKPETNDPSNIYGYETIHLPNSWNLTYSWFCDFDGDMDGECVPAAGWTCYWRGTECKSSWPI